MVNINKYKYYIKRMPKYVRNLVWYILNSHKFRSLGKSCEIHNPLLISKRYIELGNGVVIWHHARIQAVVKYLSNKYSPRIIFCNGVSVQQNIHLTCANYIIIGANTAIAANVTITDIHHPYDDVGIPIEQQDILVSEVVIGEDCKIYNNAVILSGVHIGKHVTIGANSLVNKDIPDFSVAVGNPVIIVKRYNIETKQWGKTKPDGSFIIEKKK